MPAPRQPSTTATGWSEKTLPPAASGPGRTAGKPATGVHYQPIPVPNFIHEYLRTAEDAAYLPCLDQRAGIRVARLHSAGSQQAAGAPAGALRAAPGRYAAAGLGRRPVDDSRALAAKRRMVRDQAVDDRDLYRARDCRIPHSPPGQGRPGVSCRAGSIPVDRVVGAVQDPVSKPI